MMQKYFLFFIIISYTYCKIIYFWRGRGLELTPEKTDTNYAYIKTEEFDYYKEIELTFTDNGTSFCYNELEICYTNEEPLNNQQYLIAHLKLLLILKKIEFLIIYIMAQNIIIDLEYLKIWIIKFQKIILLFIIELILRKKEIFI